MSRVVRILSEAEIDATIEAAAVAFVSVLIRKLEPDVPLSAFVTDSKLIEHCIASALLAAMRALPASAAQNAIPQRGEPLGRIEGEQGSELPGDDLPSAPGGRVAPSDGVSGHLDVRDWLDELRERRGR